MPRETKSLIDPCILSNQITWIFIITPSCRRGAAVFLQAMKLALCAALIIIVGLCNAEDLLSEARWDLAGAAIWTSGTTYLVAFGMHQ